MKSILFICLNLLFHKNTKPNLNIIIKGVLLALLVLVPLCLYVPAESANDFRTLDGDDREEVITGQSTNFFLRKEFSLTKPYQGPWNLAGNALITGDLIRLTPDYQSRRGAIYSRLPVHIANWEAHINFRVHGNTGKHFGDGLAFWYVDPAATKFPGPVFGGQDTFRGLGVFLDSYSNAYGPSSHFHPYLSAVVNNGSLAYKAEADGERREPVGCTASFRNLNHETLIAIRYSDNILSVSIDFDNRGSWRRCFKIRGVHLPTHYVFGLSAMTGELSDNHDILYMKVYEVESTQNLDDFGEDRRHIEPSIDPLPPMPATTESPQPEPGPLELMLSSLLLLLLLCAAVWLAWRCLRRRRLYSAHRFY